MEANLRHPPLIAALAVLVVALAAPRLALAVDPAPMHPNTIRTADGRDAAATFLPSPSGGWYLILDTPDEPPTILHVTADRPTPTPTPTPPTPPNDEPISVAIVRDPIAITPAAASILLADSWRAKITTPNRFLGVVSPDVTDWRTGQTPTELRPAIDAAAPLPLPAVVIHTASGQILHAGPLPATLAALEELIDHHKPKGTKNVPHNESGSIGTNPPTRRLPDRDTRPTRPRAPTRARFLRRPTACPSC